MKRLDVHVAVTDLPHSIGFYSAHPHGRSSWI
jgi:hypothetical protein